MHRILLGLATCLVAADSASAAEPKNVLLLIADDLGFQMGCYRDPVARTPNLDALAATGTRFTHAFACAASCSPSRSTILTGLPTHQSGQYGLAHGTHNVNTMPKVQSLPGLLQPAGVFSAAIAKLHVVPKEVYPFTAAVGAGNGRNPVALVDQFQAMLTQTGDKPFFMLVGFIDPHRSAKGFGNELKFPAGTSAYRPDPATIPLPYHLPDQPEVRAELVEYHQAVSRLDDAVGRILNALKASGKAESTLVIFVSDNGIPFPGAKTTLYDAGLHLPMIVRKPGQQASVTSAMVSWTDLAPTMLDWFGMAKPNGLLGRSVLPILNEPNPKGWDEVYGSHQFHEVTMYYPMRMIRTRTHKLIANLAHGLDYPHASDLWDSSTTQGILRRNDDKLGERLWSRYVKRPKFELYDLVADPNELRNLADVPEHQAKRADLSQRLLAHRKVTADPWLIKEKHE